MQFNSVADCVLSTVPALTPSHVQVGEAIVGLTFEWVVLVSAIGGGAGGIALIGTCTSVSTDMDRRFRGRLKMVVGAVLVGLGLSTVGPHLLDQSVLASVGALCGGVLVWAIGMCSSGKTVTATVTTLIIHQCLEGMALATAYVTGGVVGVAAAIALTGHTAFETAIVGAAAVTVDRAFWGAIAIVAMQSVYVLAALTTFLIEYTMTDEFELLFASLIGGAMITAGVGELRESMG